MIRASRIVLGILAILSLTLVTTVNRAAGRLFPGCSWLPDSCVASFLVCLAIYIGIRPRRPFGPPDPETDWKRIASVGATWLVLWLFGCAMVALAHGHWIRYRLAHGPAQLVAFLLLGPVQEEMLFRGAIFELV